MDRAGFHQLARRFLAWAHRTISNDGYFLHKYNPDGLVRIVVEPLGAQRPEATAHSGRRDRFGLWLLARHYDRTRDIEFVRSVYERLVLQPAEFMAAYRDPVTGLPAAVV